MSHISNKKLNTKQQHSFLPSQGRTTSKTITTPRHTNKELLKCTFSEILNRNEANHKDANNRGMKVQVKAAINSN